MLEESEINSLMEELNSLKSELRDFRVKINSLDQKKEELFREKRRVSSEIFAKIQNAHGYKEKRNSLTSIVKDSKHSREELEEILKKLDADIHSLKDEKRKILEKLGIDDPMKIKKQIKQLEFKIETSALSFDKERELMKVVSKLKKQFESSKSVGEIEKKLDVKFRELREIREQLDMTRKIVQHSAKESQKQHVELIESSKNIDDLKDKEQHLEESIGKYKSEIHALNDEMSKKLGRLDEIKKKLSENNIKFREDFEKTGSEILKQKDVEVQEKLKTGKKLTTEDLLVLQRTMKG
jgi:uncharacterized coiled-coil DUF342 family protein